MLSPEKIKSMSTLEILDLIISNKTLRNIALHILEKKSYKALMETNAHLLTLRTRLGRFYLVRGLLYSLCRALDRNLISKNVRRTMARNFVQALVEQDKDSARQKFVTEFGFEPPLFILISPEGKCNLNCIGCYANSTENIRTHLEWDIVDRIMTEKRSLWGSRFTVISGGEPFIWRSQGKGILDLAETHNDNIFMCYTNGTVITREIAQRMAEVGNISPVISVEGLEKETDERRGKGVFRRILQAMEHLRDAGVPFGISVTVTTLNMDVVFTDEMMDFWFEQQGATYGWIFQYMPIGRKITLDLMVPPHKRAEMFHQMERIVTERKYFIVDFWNSGPYTYGCLSAGTPGGYFYIDWNGNCAPCVFFPYSTCNIIDIYKQNGTLNDVLFNPLFVRIRKWQEAYGKKRNETAGGNQLLPCPIRDHYAFAHSIICELKAKPIDISGEEALNDEQYRKGMLQYDKEIKKYMDPIWQEQFIASGKEVPATDQLLVHS